MTEETIETKEKVEEQAEKTSEPTPEKTKEELAGAWLTEAMEHLGKLKEVAGKVGATFVFAAAAPVGENGFRSSCGQYGNPLTAVGLAGMLQGKALSHIGDSERSEKMGALFGGLLGTLLDGLADRLEDEKPEDWEQGASANTAEPQPDGVPAAG